MAEPPSIDSIQAAMMEELGVQRQDFLPMEDRPKQNQPPQSRPGRRAGFNAAMRQIERNPNPVFANTNQWKVAINEGQFKDEDAQAVEGLDTIGGGRLHDQRRNPAPLPPRPSSNFSPRLNTPGSANLSPRTNPLGPRQANTQPRNTSRQAQAQPQRQASAQGSKKKPLSARGLNLIGDGPVDLTSMPPLHGNMPKRVPARRPDMRPGWNVPVQEDVKPLPAHPLPSNPLVTTSTLSNKPPTETPTVRDSEPSNIVFRAVIRLHLGGGVAPPGTIFLCSEPPPDQGLCEVFKEGLRYLRIPILRVYDYSASGRVYTIFYRQAGNVLSSNCVIEFASLLEMKNFNEARLSLLSVPTVVAGHGISTDKSLPASGTLLGQSDPQNVSLVASSTKPEAESTQDDAGKPLQTTNIKSKTDDKVEQPANERLFGVKSEYDEKDDATKIDKSLPQDQGPTELPDKKARENEGGSSGGVLAPDSASLLQQPGLEPGAPGSNANPVGIESSMLPMPASQLEQTVLVNTAHIDTDSDDDFAGGVIPTKVTVRLPGSEDQRGSLVDLEDYSVASTTIRQRQRSAYADELESLVSPTALPQANDAESEAGSVGTVKAEDSSVLPSADDLRALREKLREKVELLSGVLEKADKTIAEKEFLEIIKYSVADQYMTANNPEYDSLTQDEKREAISVIVGLIDAVPEGLIDAVRPTYSREELFDLRADKVFSPENWPKLRLVRRTTFRTTTATVTRITHDAPNSALSQGPSTSTNELQVASPSVSGWDSQGWGSQEPSDPVPTVVEKTTDIQEPIEQVLDGTSAADCTIRDTRFDLRPEPTAKSSSTEEEATDLVDLSTATDGSVDSNPRVRGLGQSRWAEPADETQHQHPFTGVTPHMARSLDRNRKG